MRTGESVTGSSAAAVASTIGMRLSAIEKARFALILMRTCCGYRSAAICNPEAARENVVARLNGYLAELQQAIYADSTKEGAQTTIGEIAEVIDRLHSKKPQRQPSGKPLIQLNNIIDDGILNMADTFYISEDDYAKWISRCEVKPGDCVITNVGRIGAVSQVPRGTTAAMGRNMTCIRPGAYAATVITALCSNAMRYEIEKRTDAGTIMNALNVRNIPKLEFYLPPAEVRDSVEATLKTIQDARELLLKERQEFAALRDALLPKLMSGEIDVSKIDLMQLNSHLLEVLTYWRREGIADCHIWQIDTEIRFGAPRLFCH